MSVIWFVRCPANKSRDQEGELRLARNCGKRHPAVGGAVRVAILIFLFSWTCGSVRAQTGGSISGTIQDQSGGVVPNADVTVHNLDTTAQQATKTNTQG